MTTISRGMTNFAKIFGHVRKVGQKACWVGGHMHMKEERRKGRRQGDICPLGRRAVREEDGADRADTSTVMLGERVRLAGLSAKPELNNQLGLARTFHSERGRYGVLLVDSGKSTMAW